MSSELIIHASDASFEQDVLKSDVPVLLDFWAPWCPEVQQYRYVGFQNVLFEAGIAGVDNQFAAHVCFLLNGDR